MEDFFGNWFKKKDQPTFIKWKNDFKIWYVYMIFGILILYWAINYVIGYKRKLEMTREFRRLRRAREREAKKWIPGDGPRIHGKYRNPAGASYKVLDRGDGLKKRAMHMRPRWN